MLKITPCDQAHTTRRSVGHSDAETIILGTLLSSGRKNIYLRSPKNVFSCINHVKRRESSNGTPRFHFCIIFGKGDRLSRKLVFSTREPRPKPKRKQSMYRTHSGDWPVCIVLVCFVLGKGLNMRKEVLTVATGLIGLLALF